MTRWMRTGRPPRWARASLVALATPIALVLAVNALVAVALPSMLNASLERARIEYGLAWMSWPGTIEVRHLRIGSRGRADEWLLEADRARFTVELAALRERRFVATDVVGDGVAFRFRLRTDGAPDPDAPPIPELATLPDPEERSPPGDPWKVELGHVTVTGLRELWIEDYRYLGDGRATGAFSLGGAGRLDVDGLVLSLEGGELSLGPDPVATRVEGVLQVSIDAQRARPLLQALDGRAALVADLEDLGFLDEYLGDAGWLSLHGGRGSVVADAVVGDGALQPGSRVQVDATDLHARFFGYTGLGDGQVVAEVTQDGGGVVQGRVRVGFRDFTLVRGTDPRPLVQGSGLTVEARSPDVALDRPFARLDVTIELPESAVPDLTVYNRFLPSKLDLGIRGGRGRIRGSLRGSTEDDQASGELVLTGSSVRATYGELDVVGDFEVVGRVPHARLAEGRLDLTGSTAQLRNLTVVGGDRASDDSHAWWAALAVPSGFVAMDAPVFFDATMQVRFRDSVPFVTMFTEHEPMPGWVRGLLAIRDVSGRTRVRLGDDLLSVDELELAGRRFEVRMRMRRHEALSRGILFVRLGRLSLGVRMHGHESDVHLLDARRWYEEQRDPAP